MKREKTDMGQNQEDGDSGYSHKRGASNGSRDPSGNVLDLVDAAVQRQDDLRAQESRYIHAMADLRASYDEKLRITEADRLNAIRAVDNIAVQQAASTAELRANTLAGTVQASAEALRTQVQDAATAATIALGAALSPIQSDVADLRKTQYEAAGQKTQVVESREVNTNKNSGGMLFVAIGMGMFAFINLILMIIVATGGKL